MITVCLLAYNRPNYLGFAIESILAQTFVDFELLIIDNGSNIDTQKILRGDFTDFGVSITTSISGKKYYTLTFAK